MKTRLLPTLFASSSSVAVLLISAVPAYAQDAASEEEQAGIEEIIVTAEKRPTNVQDVPIAITALSAEELERSNVNGTRGLSGLAPNVSIGQEVRGLVISIRGISSNNVTFSRDPSVAFHVDGVYQARPTGASGTFYDLERVEILRGPQGTLYGRNSTGGTVNVVTAKPNTSGVSGFVNASYGNYDATNVQAALNVPFIEDKAAIRVAFSHGKHDGYARSLVAGKPSFDDQDDQAIRIGLLLKPSEDFKILVGGDYQWQGGTGQLNAPLTLPARTVNFNADSRQNNKLYGIHGELTYCFGSFDIISLTSMRRDIQNLFSDNDFGPTGVQTLYIGNVGKQFTQEVRAVSTGDGPFKWIIGGFYLRETNADKGILFTNTTLTNGTRQVRSGRLTTSKSVFGQIDYTLFDALTLTAGGRYTKDYKEAPNGENCNFTARVCTTPNTYVAPVPFKGNKFTWRLGAKWDVSERSNIYASVAKGYKAGGFNAAPPGYAPEQVTAYEIGTKNRFLDNRLQLNASAFYSDYADFQIQSLQTIGGVVRTIITNAGAATVKGFELEAVLRPVSNFQIDASFGYLKTNFDRLLNANDPITRTAVNLTGNELPRAPKTTWRLSARYDADIGSGTLTPSVSLQGQSRQFFTEFNDRVFTVGARTVTEYARLQQKGWTMVNASLRYEHGDNDWFVEAFGQNLGNKTVLSAGLLVTNVPQGSYNAPRTYGIKAGVKF